MRLRAVAFLLALPLAAVAARPAPTAYTVENLNVEGNHDYSAQQIFAAAGLRVGQKAGKSEFDAAQKKLEATGAFDNVSYRFAPSQDNEGYDATYEVAEVAQIYPVRFQDLPATRRPAACLAQAERSAVRSEDPGDETGGGSLCCVDFRIPGGAGLSPATGRQVELGRRRGAGGAVPSGQRAAGDRARDIQRHGRSPRGSFANRDVWRRHRRYLHRAASAAVVGQYDPTDLRSARIVARGVSEDRNRAGQGRGWRNGDGTSDAGAALQTGSSEFRGRRLFALGVEGSGQAQDRSDREFRRGEGRAGPDSSEPAARKGIWTPHRR